MFCSRQTKSLKTKRKAAYPTTGIANGLLHKRPCPWATCYSITRRHMQGLSNTLPCRNTGPDPWNDSRAYYMCFGFVLGFVFFFLISSPYFTPSSSAWGLGPSWQKLKFRREHTWQTGLPSLTKQTKLKAIPTSQASHPKDNTNGNSLPSNSKHPRLKGGVTWLSWVEVLTSPEVRSHVNMGLLSRNWKRHWRGTNTWQKGLIAQTTLTLGSVYPLVPSSLLSPNIPICLKAPPASC